MYIYTHIENPSPENLGNAISWFCFQKVVWFPSESWAGAAERSARCCFARWACGQRGVWCIWPLRGWADTVKSPTQDRRQKAWEGEELVLYFQPEIPHGQRRIQSLRRPAYWSGGSKDFALLSISEHLGVSSYWPYKLNPLNNMIHNLFADTFPSLLYMYLT